MAQTQFADIQTVFTHRVVFIMFKKIENPASCEMQSVICFLKQAEMLYVDLHFSLMSLRKVSAVEEETE